MQTQLSAHGSSAGKWVKVFLSLAFSFMPLTVKAEESGYRCISSFMQVTQGSALQVFEAPDIGTRNLGELTQGTQVLRTLVDRSGLFSQVQVSGGRQGWVLTSRLSYMPSEVRRFNGFLQVKTLDGNRVNVREDASRKAKVLRKLDSGNVVRFHRNEGEWSYVTDSSMKSGYIANNYLICTTARFQIGEGPDRN
jgi:hypothetical protein